MYCQCAKNELSIFDPLPIQNVVLNGVWEDVYPLHSVVGNDSPIEFNIYGNDSTMLDLNDTLLVIDGQIRLPNGNAVADANAPMPVNLQLHTMFADVQVTINDTKIEGGHFLHPYKSYMSCLLQYSKEYKDSQMRAAGYAKDTATHFDAPQQNLGGVTRIKKHSYQLAGPILSNFLQQGKYLMSNTNISLKLFRAKPSFFLQTHEAEIPYNYVMTSAVLYVRRCQVNPSVLAGHLKGLQTRPALYPIQNVDMQTFTVAQGLQSVVKDNILNGKSSKLIILGMVLNTSFNGTYATNPFNFQNFGVKEISLYKNGETCPFRPLTPTWEANTGKYMREYMAFFQSLGMFNTPSMANDISITDYANGFCFFAFNLCPDLDYDGSHGQLKTVPSIRLDLKFQNALAHPINIILYSINDAVVTIDKDGIVTLQE